MPCFSENGVPRTSYSLKSGSKLILGFMSSTWAILRSITVMCMPTDPHKFEELLHTHEVKNSQSPGQGRSLVTENSSMRRLSGQAAAAQEDQLRSAQTLQINSSKKLGGQTDQVPSRASLKPEMQNPLLLEYLIPGYDGRLPNFDLNPISVRGFGYSTLCSFSRYRSSKTV